MTTRTDTEEIKKIILALTTVLLLGNSFANSKKNIGQRLNRWLSMKPLNGLKMPSLGFFGWGAYSVQAINVEWYPRWKCHDHTLEYKHRVKT